MFLDIYMFLDKLNCYFMSVLFWRNEVEEKVNSQKQLQLCNGIGFSYATETLGLVFMMDVSEVKANFKVFHWLSVTDKSNIGTCVFQFTVLCKMKMFFSWPKKAKLFFLMMAKLKIFFFVSQSSFTMEKNERKKNERMELCYGTKYSVLMRKYSNACY